MHDGSGAAPSAPPSAAVAAPAADQSRETAVVASSKIDGGIRTAASVASYLRSAIRRRGDLFRVQDGSGAAVTVAVATDVETDGESDELVDSGDREEGKPATSESDTQSSAASTSESLSPPLSVDSTEQDALGRFRSGESLRLPSSPVRGYRAPAAAPSPASSHTPRRYEVTFERLRIDSSEIQADVAGLQETKKPLVRAQTTEYVDVLLQTDAHGLGLNVGSISKAKSEEAVVVQSFRRLHFGDVGPAEASGKIRVGDELFSVDGERMTSIHQLHAKVSRVQSGSFLLLRFLRPNESPEIDASSSSSIPETSSVDNDDEEEEDCEDKAAPSSILDVEHAIRDNPQVSALIRDLVAANQRLQEQALASRLKQDELTIQLDQLYSLYARTQLDNGMASSFSLPKTLRPFSWRNGHRAGSLDDGTSEHHPLGINRAAYSSKVLLEIEEAVGAEYGRLRRNYELEYSLDKKKLERRFAEKTQQLEAAMAKKIDMLQAGLEQVAREGDYREPYDAVVTRCSSCDCEILPDTVENNIGDVRISTQRIVQLQNTEEEQSSRQKLDAIVAILDEYRRSHVDKPSPQTLDDLYEEKPEEASILGATSSIDGETRGEVSKNQEPETVEAECSPLAA